MKNKIKFTKKAIEDRLNYSYEWFDCCRKNLQKNLGTPQRKRWKDYLLHVMKEIFELEEILEEAPSEKE